VAALNVYGNVNLRSVNLNSFFMDSPLQPLWTAGTIPRSKHLASHLSDLMRYLILHSFGGTWMDSDQIVLKAFPEEDNFLGEEREGVIAGGVIRLQRGHPAAAAILAELAATFDPDVYHANGPFMLTRALTQFCGSDRFSPDNCMGIQFWPSSTFYPVPWRKWESLFDQGEPALGRPLVIVGLCFLADQAESLSNETLSVHFWGGKSRKKKMLAQPEGGAFSILAAQNCPQTYGVSCA